MNMSTDLITSETVDFNEAVELASFWLEHAGSDFQPEFPRIKSKGGLLDFGDELPPAKSARGIVVAWHPATRLYLTKLDDAEEGASRRPDAWSNDGKVQVVPHETLQKIAEINVQRVADGLAPLPNPDVNLEACPYSKWADEFASGRTPLGSTKGKDSNEYRELFIVLTDADTIVPFQLTIPATSVKAWNGKGGYVNKLMTFGTHWSQTETVINAAVEKSGGNEWTVFSFERGRKIEPTVKAQSYEYAKGVEAYVKQDPFAIARAAELAAPVEQAQLPAPVAPVEPVATVDLEALAEPVVAEAPVEPAAEPEAPAADPGVEAVAEAFNAEPVAVGVGADGIDF